MSTYKNTDAMDERLSKKERLVDIFFYGLYMDETILAKHNVNLRQPRNGYIDEYRLRIGNNATIIKEEGSKVHGVVCALTHEEIYRLYIGAGLHNYVPEAFMVKLADDSVMPSLCYLLCVSPDDNEKNPSYYKKLVNCMRKRDLPIPKQY